MVDTTRNSTKDRQLIDTANNDENIHEIVQSEDDPENIEDDENIEELDAEQDEDDDGESSDMTASDDDACWISWFVNIRGNNYFCEVDEAYIQDDFNLAGLSTQVPYYDYALDMILDVDFSLEGLSEEQQEIIETAAEVLYGLIHARFILTSAGMHKMYDKYVNVDFGRCPRSLCQGQPVLPIGLSDITREFSVEVFCPRCHEVYHPRSSKHSNIDGAYFGTTFAHLFLLTHPELVVPRSVESFTPRIFGFRIHESSQYYQLREPHQLKRKPVVKSSSSKEGNLALASAGEDGSTKLIATSTEQAKEESASGDL